MAGIRMYVKLVGGLVALALFLVACNQAAAPGSETLVAQAVGDRYIVVLNEAASADFPGRGRSIAADVARGYGLQVTHTYGAAIVGFAAQIPAGRLAQLRADPRVKYVETDDPVHIFSQTVPTGISRIFADSNGNLDIDGSDDFRVDVDVAVIDTGIDFDHPDLNVAGGVDCTVASGGGPPWARTYTCDPSGGDDDHYHGTHVAGTIGALDNGIGVVGVAPGARLWAVKVLDSSGSGYESMIVNGIDWVAANASTIEVANMSLGGSGFSQAEYDAIQGAVNKGVAFAVAAGNSDADANNYSPAAFDNVLTVSALADFDGKAGANGSSTCRVDQDDTLADFSNWGDAVQIAAPGVCILSTYPIEQGGYGTISGTSMASPHAAGALALLASASKPTNTEGVYALYDQVVNSGNLNWTDDSGDGIKERLLDVSSASLYVPLLIAVDGGGGGSEPINSSPGVTIVSPSDGANFDSGSPITFSGTATDQEDGDLSDSIAWNSDKDGNLGTGSSISVVLTNNTHTVTASVTDLDGATTTDTVSVTVGTSSGAALSLSATPYKVKGLQRVELSWTGAGISSVDVYRDGTRIISGVATSPVVDEINTRGGGSYTYSVCEAGTATVCEVESDPVTVSF